MRSTNKLTRAALFLALTLVFQIGFRQFAQPAVGPLVNMMLIFSAMIVGPFYAVIIGILTPVIALLVGIIALPPLIPMIAFGNTIYVIVFSGVLQVFPSEYNKFAAGILASVFKFGFLYTAVRHLLTFFIPEVKPPIIATFSMPQLYTALIGAGLAILITYFLPRKFLKRV